MRQQERFRAELLERVTYRMTTFLGVHYYNNPGYATIYMDRYGSLSCHIRNPPDSEGFGEQILLIPYRCIPEHGDSETEAIQHYLSWAEGELLQEANLLLEEVMG